MMKYFAIAKKIDEYGFTEKFEFDITAIKKIVPNKQPGWMDVWYENFWGQIVVISVNEIQIVEAK